jgi:PAS domain S-box-containing protein
MSTAAGDAGSSGENVRNDALAFERVEEALVQSEANYRSLFESIDEGFCVIEMLFDERGKPVDYRFLEMNAAFERQTGLVNAQGRTVQELVPGHEEHWFEIFGRVALTGEATRFQNHAAQLRRWYDVYAWRRGKPQNREVAVLFNDVTASKQAEEALRESEESLRLVWRATRETLWDWDIEHDRQRWSDAGAEAFGWTDAVEAPQTAAWWTERVYGEDRERVAEGFRRALEDPTCERWQDEYRFLRRDGSVADVLDRGYILRDASGKPKRMIGAMQDISERKRAETAALAAEAQARLRLSELEELYRNAPVGLCLLDRELRFLRINERLAEINGLPAEEHLGKTVREAVPIVADLVETSLREVVETGRARFGIEVVGETPAHPGVQRTWLEHWLPVKDAAGRVMGVNIVVEEITERKQAEAALKEANRRKDAFLATLAHELRNPLASLRTGLDLLQVLRGDAVACEEPLRIMDRQLHHLVHLVNDLLDVSRISRGVIALRKERLDLAEIIDTALEMSASGLRRGERRLAVDVPPESLPVEGDRVRLAQVVSNLLNNAAKFTEAGGRITLRVVRRGDRAEILVQDDGRGIPRERLAEIFEMFSQSEPGRDAGLGIGLSIVRSLVALHGGTVWAESDGPGRGAAFTVSLPLCDSLPAQPAPQEATDTDAIAKRRVLVVDDNRDIVEGLRLLLTVLKAEVRIAHDGAEALRVCADWEPTHILMDLGLPGMDGYEAARRLRANHPDRAFRLIAITGWGQDEDRQRTREAGFDRHLVKPVGVAELKSVLAS